jgi:hypothetical protein
MVNPIQASLNRLSTSICELAVLTKNGIDQFSQTCSEGVYYSSTAIVDFAKKIGNFEWIKGPWFSTCILVDRFVQKWFFSGCQEFVHETKLVFSKVASCLESTLARRKGIKDVHIEQAILKDQKRQEALKEWFEILESKRNFVGKTWLKNPLISTSTDVAAPIDFLFCSGDKIEPLVDLNWVGDSSFEAQHVYRLFIMNSAEKSEWLRSIKLTSDNHQLTVRMKPSVGLRMNAAHENIVHTRYNPISFSSFIPLDKKNLRYNVTSGNFSNYAIQIQERGIPIETIHVVEILNEELLKKVRAIVEHEVSLQEMIVQLEKELKTSFFDLKNHLKLVNTVEK